jgi:hemolysin activation/secretion protein
VKWFCYGFLMLWCVSQAQAQVALTDPGSRLLEEERQRKIEELLLRKEVPIAVPVREEEDKKDSVCFTITNIIVEGATKVTPEEISKVTDAFLGCVGMHAIRRLAHALENLYISKGYIAARLTLLPDQSLADGVLEYRVVEGEVTSLSLNKNHWRDRLRLKMAMPVVAGDIVLLPAIEQGMEQLRHISSSRAELLLEPDKTKAGVVIRVEDQLEDPIRGHVYYDNYGQSSTGTDRLRMSMEADNLLALSEQLAFHYVGSHDTNALAMHASMPYHYWTFSVDGSYSDYLSLVGDVAELFGTTWNVSGKAERVVYKSKQDRTALSFGVNVKESGRLLNDVVLAPQQLTVLRVGGTHRRRTASSVWMLDGAVSQGMPWLGAMDDVSDVSSLTPRAQFTKVDGGLTWIKPLKKGRLQSTLRGQYAFDALYGSEQINMGDYQTVRGYTGSVLAGDSGAYVRNDWYVPVPKPLRLRNIAIQPHVFMDGGLSKIKAVGGVSAITGVGVGFDMTWKRMGASVALSAPLYADSEVEHDRVELSIQVSTKLW